MGNIITSSPKVNTSSLASSKKEVTTTRPVITSPINLSKVGTLTNNINKKNNSSTEIETLDLFLQDKESLIDEENLNTVDMKRKLIQTDLTEEEIEDLIIEYTETIEINRVIKDALEAQYDKLLYLTGTDYNALYNEYTMAITNSVNEIQETIREGINSNKEELTEEEQQILTKLNITREQFQSYEYKEEDFTSAVFACSSLVQEEIKTYNEIYNTKIPTNKYDITSFEQYIETMQYLQTNIITLEQNIALREEDIKVLPYLKEMSKEDYQSYVDTKITLSEEELHRALSGNVYEYGTYLTNQGEGQDISPLDFYLQVKDNTSIGYTLAGSKIAGIPEEKLKNLIEASELEGSPDFKKLYNYYYYTQGLEAANEYLENIESEINKSIALVAASTFLNTLPEGCSAEEAAHRFSMLTGKGLTDGIRQYAQGIFGWLDPTTSKSILDYESLYIIQALQPKEVKEQMGLITEEGNSCIEEIDFTKDYSGILHISDNVYEIASGIGNMAPSIGLGLIGGSVFSSASLMISAGGNSYHDARVSGYSEGGAILYGLISGASEAIFEKTLGAIPGLGNTEVTSLKTLVQSIAKEGFEEGSQELLDIYIRGVMFNEEVTFDELVARIGKSAAYGAITAGVLNGISLPIKMTMEQAMNVASEYQNLTIQEICSKINLVEETNEVNTNNSSKEDAKGIRYKIWEKMINQKIDNYIKKKNISGLEKLLDNTSTIEELYTIVSKIEEHRKRNEFSELYESGELWANYNFWEHYDIKILNTIKEKVTSSEDILKFLEYFPQNKDLLKRLNEPSDILAALKAIPVCDDTRRLLIELTSPQDVVDAAKLIFPKIFTAMTEPYSFVDPYYKTLLKKICNDLAFKLKNAGDTRNLEIIDAIYQNFDEKVSNEVVAPLLDNLHETENIFNILDSILDSNTTDYAKLEVIRKLTDPKIIYVASLKIKASYIRENILQNLDLGQWKAILENLDSGKLKEILENLDSGKLKEILENLDSGKLKEILLQNLDSGKLKEILQSLDLGQWPIEILKTYPFDYEEILKNKLYSKNLETTEQYKYIIQKIAEQYNIPETRLKEAITYLGSKNQEIFQTINYNILKDEYYELITTNNKLYINITSHPEIQDQIIENSLSNGSINQSYIQNLSNLVQFMNRNLNYNTSMESYLYQLLNNKNITNIITSLENTTLTEKQMNDLLTYSISDHQYKITSIEDLNNIDKIRKQYCQRIMNNPGSTLAEIQDATLEAMYGISTRTARNVVINFSEITKHPEIFGEETISIINGINRILSETYKAQLRGDRYIVSGESLAIDIVNFARRIRNLYLEEYNKVLFKPSKDNYIEKKEGIDIYRTPEEWAMFIHSLGAFSGADEIVPWNIPLTSYQNICMSFINNDYIVTAPVHGLILGFTDFEAYSLLAMGARDLASGSQNMQFASELFLLNADNGQFFLPTDLITATEKIHTYNEVVFSRRGGEEKRQPAYAIYFCNEYDPNSPDFKNYLKKVEEFNKQQPEGKEISIVVIERK